eukprot:8837121-Alexandrium_andersonii.AAC.1
MLSGSMSSRMRFAVSLLWLVVLGPENVSELVKTILFASSLGTVIQKKSNALPCRRRPAAQALPWGDS